LYGGYPDILFDAVVDEETGVCAPTIDPSAVSSYEYGAKGWLTWLSLAIMLAEALTSLSFLALKQIGPACKAACGGDGAETDDVEVAPLKQRVPATWWMTGLLIASAATVGTISPLFNIPYWQSILSVFLSCFIGVLAVRALGATDLNPASGVGKLSQLIFAAIPGTGVVTNVIAGGIAESAAIQAGDLMQDMKAAHILRSSPRAMFMGQLIGASVSSFVTVAAYNLYQNIYNIGDPNGGFPAPSMHIWRDMAEVLSKGTDELDPSVMDVGLYLVIAGIALPVLEEILPTALHAFLPSGVALGMGIYVTPNWIFPRFVGSLWELVWRKCAPEHYDTHMLMVASGLVLGEGFFSIFALVIDGVGMPKFELTMIEGGGGGGGGGGGH